MQSKHESPASRPNPVQPEYLSDSIPLSEELINLKIKLYSVLGSINRTGNPAFISTCLDECRQILAPENNPIPASYAPKPAAYVFAPRSDQQNSNKRKEPSDSWTATATSTPAHSKRRAKKVKTDNKPLTDSEKNKEKATDADSAPTVCAKSGEKPKGKTKKVTTVRKIISPDLIEFIELKKANRAEMEEQQRIILAKNARYYSRLSMEHVSSIGKRADTHKEIKQGFPEELKRKFTYSHHITYPFTVKKMADSLPRSELYKDPVKRRNYIESQVMSVAKTNPALAVQNLMYLYQHHLLCNIYLRMHTGSQLGDVILQSLSLQGFNFDKNTTKSLKSAFKSSYDQLARKPVFQKFSMMPQVNVSSESDDSLKGLEGTDIASVTLIENKEKTIEPGETINSPFPNSIKIDKDTNFYDEKGTLVGIYRRGIIPPELISNKLRNDISSITQITLNRIGASSKVEKSNVKQKRLIRSAPFGIVGANLARVRPTLFSEFRPDIETEMKPIVEIADSLYRQWAPSQYQQRCEDLGYAKAFTLSGSRHLLTMEANFDKQTTTHTDKNQKRIKGLNPLFVIYPSNPAQKGPATKSYKGGYTFFPGVLVRTNNSSNSCHEGFYVDLEEGDVFLFDFDNYIHCNTDIEVPEEVKQLWHRISCILFSKDVKQKIKPPAIFEHSDDEDSAYFEEEVDSRMTDTYGQLPGYFEPFDQNNIPEDWMQDSRWATMIGEKEPDLPTAEADFAPQEAAPQEAAEQDKENQESIEVNQPDPLPDQAANNEKIAIKYLESIAPHRILFFKKMGLSQPTSKDCVADTSPKVSGG
ncbi:hypothetical protein [Legionella sp. 29fVS95]|uniref:hypothetical protein n=1 Tax=Legionella sp. 29fVS95 TaxID=3402813 RepID=UPI003AF7DE8D